MEHVRKTEKLIDLLAEKSMSNGVISEENASIYRYGVKHLLLMPLYFFSYLSVGIVTDNLFWLCIYLLAFTAIRVYAGGFHLKHRSSCFLFTIGMVGVSSVLLKHYEYFFSIPVWSVIMIAGYIVILWLAPIDSSKRTFDEQEKIYFRKIAIRIAAIEFILFGVTLILKSVQCAFVFVLAFLVETIFLLLGKWLRERDKSAV